MKHRYLCATGLAALAAFACQQAAAQESLNLSGKLEAGDEQLPSGEYVDNHIIRAHAGDLLEVRATSDDIDAYLIVRGPGDTRFENDDADPATRNPRIIERAPQDGTYTISVTSFQPGETGRYRLEASVSQRPINSSVSSTESGALASGDERLGTGEFVDNYTFTGEVGDLVVLHLSSADFDPYLMLRGPEGASFDNDDAEPGVADARIEATLPVNGEYTVMVTSYAPRENGDYTLDVTGAQVAVAPSRSARALFGDAGPGTALAIGATAYASLADSDNHLESGEFYDIYTLEGAPGTRVELRMASDAFDTYLAAFGSDGSETSNDDDDTAGGSTNSRVEVVIPISGSLTLAASSYGGDVTGAYTLAAEAISSKGDEGVDPAGSAPITLGDIVDGTLESADQTGTGGAADSFVFQAAAEQEIDFALTSDDFDPMLLLDGPAGFHAENDDDPRSRTLNSRLSAVLPEAGTYRIIVSSYGGEGRGAYRLRTGTGAVAAEADAPDLQALSLGAKIAGSLAAGDHELGSGEYADRYSFAGQRGQRLTFTMESDAFDTYLALTLPDDGRETNDDRAGLEDTNSRLSITLPEDGTYQLTATSYAPGSTGAYLLSVQTADDATRTVVPTSDNARVFLLSIGVSEYERIEGLPLTDRDAQKLSQTLAAAGVLAPQSVTLLNADATRENVASALQDLEGQAGPDDLLLVFFSGHGDKVEGVTTERDGSSETIELFDTALHDYELADMLSGFQSRLLLVIDACFSGGFDNVIDQGLDRMGIFSSDSDVLSLVAEKFQAGGYVSLLLREALEGEADSNGDLAITAGELSEYMRRGFYRLAVDAPLEAGGEDFRGEETLGYQHLIVDRGGDGMPYGQILMRIHPVAADELTEAP